MIESIPTAFPGNLSTASEATSPFLIEVALSVEKGFALDPAGVGAVGEETAAVVLTSPSNPTGRVFDPDAILEVAAVAAVYDDYVIVDEVYRGLVYERGNRAIASYADDPERVPTVDSCSKRYAMTG